MSNYITLVSNVETREFFFSPKHSTGGLGSPWVPSTYGLPYIVKPQKDFPSGKIDNVEDFVKFKEMHGNKLINMPKECKYD